MILLLLWVLGFIALIMLPFIIMYLAERDTINASIALDQRITQDLEGENIRPN